MKKITILFLILGVLVVSSYIFVRRSLRTPGFQPAPPKNGAVATKPAESPLDLRPHLIEKLQQLVKQGSNGLYNLSIHEIEPDIVSSTVVLRKLMLTPDTAVLHKMEAEGERPADVFRIAFDSIRIDGLGISDLLHKDVIDLNSITMTTPLIEIFHRQVSKRPVKDKRPLYERIAGQLKHLSVGRIDIHNGNFLSYGRPGHKPATFHGIDVLLSHVLMDSTTAYDKKRFLFAREASISTRNFSKRTKDNLYEFKAGRIDISATDGQLVAHDVQLQPLYGKQAFQQHIKYMQEWYQISIPELRLRHADWWQLINDEALYADQADISNAEVNLYLDHSKPNGPSSVSNFPHQLLMRIPFKLDLARVNVHNARVSSEEFMTNSQEAGTLRIDDLDGRITNLTNIPSMIARRGHTTVDATGTFFGKVKARMTLDFDMRHYKSGNFSAGLDASNFDATVINSVSKPLGLFYVKRAMVQKIAAQVSGNNRQAGGHVAFLYKDLHVTPLERSRNKPGLNKKHITSFIANTFVLKDDNPSGNAPPREADPQTTRSSNSSFFNLIWKATFVGILKITGAPERLANQ